MNFFEYDGILQRLPQMEAERTGMPSPRGKGDHEVVDEGFMCATMIKRAACAEILLVGI